MEPIMMEYGTDYQSLVVTSIAQGGKCVFVRIVKTILRNVLEAEAKLFCIQLINEHMRIPRSDRILCLLFLW